MRFRWQALAAISLFIPAIISADPSVTIIKGAGVLTFHGKTTRVQTVIYGIDDGTVVFQAATGSFAVGFKGSEDMQPTANQYVLKVTTVYNGRPGAPDNSRVAADGLCELDVSTDGEIVRSMNCHARTEFGEVSLVFSGRLAH